MRWDAVFYPCSDPKRQGVQAIEAGYALELESVSLLVRPKNLQQ
jgi:hypothetical protein